MIEKCVRCLLYHLLYGVHQKVTGAMQASPPRSTPLPPLRAWALLYIRDLCAAARLFTRTLLSIALKPVILENSSGAYIFIKIHIYSTQSTQQARKKQDPGGGNRSKLKSAKKRKTTVLRQVCLCQGYLRFEGIYKYIRQRLTGPLPIPQNHTVLNPEIGLYTQVDQRNQCCNRLWLCLGSN
jgi:hypothetical protein